MKLTYRHTSQSPLVLPVLLLLILIAFEPAVAHTDIFITQVSGQVAVGGAHDLGEMDESFDLTTQVFVGVMYANFPPFDPADYGRDEPGFFALSNSSPAFPAGATALPANSAISLTLSPFIFGGNLDALFYWNGIGPIDFQPISVAQPGVALAIDPNPIVTTNANGAFHAHAVFELDNGAAGVPADGVYLIGPVASAAGLADSQRFYMLWLVDALLDDEEAAEGLEELLDEGDTMYLGKDFGFFPAAVAFVESTVVPEPSTGIFLLATMFGYAMTARRRVFAAAWEVQR